MAAHLDDAASKAALALLIEGQEGGGQAQQLAQPVHHNLRSQQRCLSGSQFHKCTLAGQNYSTQRANNKCDQDMWVAVKGKAVCPALRGCTELTITVRWGAA